MTDGAPGECVNHPREGMIMECIEYRRIERDGIIWDVSILADNEPPELDLWDVSLEYGQVYRNLLEAGTLRMVGIQVQAVGAPGLTDDMWGIEYGVVPDSDNPADKYLMRILTLQNYLTDPYLTVNGKDITLIDSLIDTALGRADWNTMQQFQAIANALSARFAASE